MEPGQEHLKLLSCQLLAMRSRSLNIGLGTVGLPGLSEAFVVARSLKRELVAQVL